MKYLAIVGAVVAVLSAGGGAVLGDDTSHGAITIKDPWARASAGPARSGAAYMTIVNKGPGADRLVSVTTGAASSAMLHTTLMEGGVMKMRHLDALAVEPGATVALQPGGTHVMLMGLKAPLKEGGRFPVTLTFEHAGPVTVQVHIKAPGAMGGMDRGMGHPMKH